MQFSSTNARRFLPVVLGLGAVVGATLLGGCNTGRYTPRSVVHGEYRAVGSDNPFMSGDSIGVGIANAGGFGEMNNDVRYATVRTD